MRTADFDYCLPEERIAQSPVEPRDAARLLRASDLTDWRVRDLPELLRPGDLAVVNETRVRAARLLGRREPTGGEGRDISAGAPRPALGGVGPAGPPPPGGFGSADRAAAGPPGHRSPPGHGRADPPHGSGRRRPGRGGGRHRRSRAGAAPALYPPPARRPRALPDRLRAPGRFIGRLHRRPALHRAHPLGVGRPGRRAGRGGAADRCGHLPPITAERIADHEMHRSGSTCRKTRCAGSGRPGRRRPGGGGGHHGGKGSGDRLPARPDGALPRPHPPLHNARLPFRGGGPADDQLPYAFLVAPGADGGLHGSGLEERVRGGLARGYRFLSFGDAMLAERSEEAPARPIK